MKALHYTHFFNLKDFEHRALFEGSDCVWHSLDRLAEYLKNFLFKGHLGSLHPTVSLAHPEMISIGEGSQIGPFVQIEGPCVIGRGCDIRHGAYIRPYTILGDGCVVGHATEVKGSIFLNGAKAPHFNYVGDSILGCDVNLGAGVICANYRLDGGEIAIKHEGERIATGRHKIGAIIGDGSSISCHTVLNPGTCLEPHYRGGAQYRLGKASL